MLACDGDIDRQCLSRRRSSRRPRSHNGSASRKCDDNGFHLFVVLRAIRLHTDVDRTARAQISIDWNLNPFRLLTGPMPNQSNLNMAFPRKDTIKYSIVMTENLPNSFPAFWLVNGSPVGQPFEAGNCLKDVGFHTISNHSGLNVLNVLNDVIEGVSGSSSPDYLVRHGLGLLTTSS
jgi:hypothetical protein